MDLVRLLRSLEEFLYELVGWLVFYPRTFWRILRHPGAIARYTRMELARDEGGQFQDTISPVLMLILSVGIAHGLELVLQTAVPTLSSPLGQRLLGSEQGLLLTRSVVFCIYALGASLATLRRERKPITRETLREPFSIQAFLVCPFLVLNALGFQLASIQDAVAHVAGLVLACASPVWYIAARVSAYRALYHGGLLRVLASTAAWFTATTVVIVTGLYALAR